MIQWFCYRDHSDEKGKKISKGDEPLRLNGSECPVCSSKGYPTHEFVDSKSELYWCENCKVPTYTDKCECCGEKSKKIAKDIRPVFPEERILLEILYGVEPGEFSKSSVWNTVGGAYIVDGKKINIKISGLKDLDIDEIREKCIKNISDERIINNNNFNEIISRFVTANKSRYSELVDEAMRYISDETKDYDISQMFASFSGGKDSTVVADLARRALSTDKLLHIYGDTTLEFPDTLEYVNRYKEQHKQTPFVISRNKEKDFNQLCEQIGPPSRVMRWCCTIFKTGAINRKIQTMFRGQNKIISFQGIRRGESSTRKKYERTSTASKIAKQIVLSPIIDWLDFDIWLYILTTGIDFNDAYRKGYSRVGCWCCPNNGEWSEFLSSIYQAEEFDRFHLFLENFASRIGKPDPEEYVRSGAWKARQGGNGVDYAQTSIVEYTPCVKEDNAFNYELRRPIEPEFYELFKPFGKIDHTLGNQRLGEVYIIDGSGSPVLKLQGRVGKTKLKITIYQISKLRAKSIKAAKEKLDCQITKYQMCMGCRGCESACKFDALSVRQLPDGRTSYTINQEKCTGCQECVNHYIGGCYMRKVLTIKRT